MARCYKNSVDYNQDPPLDEEGIKYAKNLTYTLFDHLEKSGNLQEKQQQEATPKDNNSLAIWTSVKRRTIETTQFFAAKNIPIRHRVQLSQKNPGITGTLTDDEIREKFL